MAADSRSEAHGDDLVARALGALEGAVALIRDHSTRPILLAARVLVVGVAVAFLAVLVAVATTIGIVRLLTVDAFGGRVWASDLLLAGIFVAGGGLLVGRGRRRDVGGDRD